MTPVTEAPKIKEDLQIWFEQALEPQTFAHIKSPSGILGHAEEVKRRIPSGTWITIPENLTPTVTNYLVWRCGFRYMGCLVVGTELQDLLMRI